MDTIGASRRRRTVVALLLNHGSNRPGRAVDEVSFAVSASPVRRQRAPRVRSDLPAHGAAMTASTCRCRGLLSFE